MDIDRSKIPFPSIPMLLLIMLKEWSYRVFFVANSFWCTWFMLLENISSENPQNLLPKGSTDTIIVS